MNSSTSVNGTVLPECIFHAIGRRLHQPSYSTQAVIIFSAVINAIASPITVVLNALLIIAVKKKPRLRAHKSNVLLALLATTDLMVGLILQPTFIAMITTVVQSKSGFCALQTDFIRHCAGCLVSASLTHLALISTERYLAIKHPFIYKTIVTEAHLLFASPLAWLLSVFLQISIVFGETLYFTMKTTCHIVIVSFIILCHASVYRETNRHERHVAAHQVTKEAREKFEKDKKALNITSIVVGTLLICYTPLAILRMTLPKYRYEISLNALYTVFVLTATVALLNSLINPVIYSVRLRQFRVAIIELICRNVNVTEAEQIEKRMLSPNVRQYKTTKDQLKKVRSKQTQTTLKNATSKMGSFKFNLVQ